VENVGFPWENQGKKHGKTMNKTWKTMKIYEKQWTNYGKNRFHSHQTK
jgi:hypothetical protein